MVERAPRYVVEGTNIVGYVDGEVHQMIEGKAFGTDALPVGLDLEGRMQILEQEGIWVEALLGNLAGVVVMCIEEPEFALACARAYNDWLAEYFEPLHDRVVGHADIPTCIDPGAAVAEIERAAGLGLRSIIVPLWPVEPYFLKKFDPLWEAAAAHNMPVCMHAHTGRWFRSLLWGDVTHPEVVNASLLEDQRDKAAVISAGGGISFPQQGYQCYRVSGWFIGSGTLDRLRNLHLVFLECGSAWLLSAAEWLEEVWRRVPGAERVEGTTVSSLMGGTWPYPLTPTQYLHRRVHTTFQDEQTAIKFRHQLGIDALLWGADIPHTEGTWPHTRRITDELFAGVPEDERRAITGQNFAKLFGVAVPV
jgi:predicted TIM-barrel fold metal-dependent hydrolase